jgi:UDP-glucuronate 4-epimerase
MRVLVTGAAGFIGSNLCERLVERGDEVWGLDNFNTYYDPARKWKNISKLRQNPNFNLAVADICDRSLLFNLIEQIKPEGIIHLAAMAGVRNSVAHPEIYTAVNINGSQNLLDAARKNDVCKSFVFASTSSLYGSNPEIPFNESAPCVEPLQPYAATKRAVELLAYTYHSLYNLSFTSTRFFTVYGPRGRPDMMPMLLAESITKRKEIPYYGDKMARDWTFIGDIVNGLILALDTPLGYEILNLGRGEPVPLKDFIGAMGEVAGAQPILRLEEKPAADVYLTYADCSKAQRLIGYKPTVSVKEGVTAFWDWYVQEGTLQ